MKKNFFTKCLFLLGLLLFFTFLPQIMPTSVSIARASEIEKEKNNEYRLNLRAITLVNGKSFTLRVYNLEKDAKVSFKSADPEIASVNEDGTFTANKVGTTTITATVKRGLNTTSLNCDVTVGPPAFSVKLTRPMIILELDQVYQLEVVLKPVNTAELVKFSSYDPTIASVSTGGRVTAKKVGMTYVFAAIDATNQDGSRKFSSCSVIVDTPENVAQLNDYFAAHPELSLLSEYELSKALFEVLNIQEQALSNTSSASGSTEGSGNSTSNAANTSQASKEDIALSETDTQDSPSFIDTINNHLNSKFNLADLRKKYDERFQISTEVQLASMFGFGGLIKR